MNIIRPVFFLYLLIYSLAWTQILPQEQMTSIALFNLDAKGIDLELSELISDALLSELNNTNIFMAMERSKMQEVLDEQGFQESGACDSSTCQVQMGELLGIDQMIVGSIGYYDGTYILNLRRLDISTGKIIATSSNSVSGKIDMVLNQLVPKTINEVCGLNTSPASYKLNTPAPPQRSATKKWENNSSPRPQKSSLAACGIGGSISPDSETLAVVFNILTTYGLPASTSGTSTPSACSYTQDFSHKLIQKSYASLEDETSIGQGQYLSVLLNSSMCPSSSHSQIIHNLRQNFSTIILDERYQELTHNQKASAYYFIYQNIIEKTPNCRVI